MNSVIRVLFTFHRHVDCLRCPPPRFTDCGMQVWIAFEVAVRAIDDRGTECVVTQGN